MQKHHKLFIALTIVVVLLIAAYVIYGSIETAIANFKQQFVIQHPTIASWLGLTSQDSTYPGYNGYSGDGNINDPYSSTYHEYSAFD